MSSPHQINFAGILCSFLTKRGYKMNTIYFIRLFLCTLAIAGIFANAQGRLSDKDIENLMGNVKDDVKSFRPHFNSAIGKSSIRKTSREKDAKNLVASLEKKAEAMRNTFRQTKKGEDNVRDVVASARQIDNLVYSVRLNPQTTSEWEKIRGEIAQVSAAFNMPEPFSRGIGPIGPGPISNEIPCAQGVGPERARRLVEECLAVSPGTHPPCNAQNSCRLITDEIKRGCNLIGQGAPGFCSEYMQGAGGAGLNQRTVSCYSDDGTRRYCDADTRNGVDLIRQRGSARCERGYSWDYDARGVWVDHGCQAEFRLR
jgi:Protein of unknown function (DUF3011)